MRLDLRDVRPPVWRRLELRGDLTLLDLHYILQIAMGWQNCHLHRFSAGASRWAPYFRTEFDLSEGDDGIPEGEVRLDQVVAKKGDALCYEYDFGDSWHHLLRVEKVLDEVPETVRCTGGRMAC
ncbi:MAG: plasmid pRiA4b ORF-3 family protein, partial [Acidipropionibacterium acidipropionici]|nr:plasmid pRiA4b ORF-3 family protein [Acidipropionibacterium acidipropionici]